MKTARETRPPRRRWRVGRPETFLRVKWGLLILATVLWGATVPAQRVSPEVSRYPQVDAWAATISVDAMKLTTARVDWQGREVLLRPERRDLPEEWIHGRTLKYGWVGHAEERPLVVIIAGLGGAYDSKPSQYLSEVAYRRGYHAVTLPSPLNWRFVTAASRDGLVGETRRDAEDLYEALVKVLEDLKNRGVLWRRVDLIGYSMGALHAAHLKRIDGERGQVGLHRAVLINPPYDFKYGMDVLESLVSQDRGDVFDRLALFLKALACVRDYRYQNVLEWDHQEDYFQGFLDQLCLSTDEMQFFVGRRMTKFLELTIPASLATFNSRRRPHERVEVYVPAGALMTTYLRRVFFPLRQVEGSLEDFLHLNGLSSVLESLKRRPDVYLMHNADDFIVTPRHLERMGQAFAGRSVISPRGGHMGNLWFSDHQRQVFDFLGGPRVKRGSQE